MNMKNTGEKVKVRWVTYYKGDVMTSRSRTQSVWEDTDGTRCVKRMGRGCWVWYELDESGDVPTVCTQTDGSRVVRLDRRRFR